ncbi:MAG: T9SS type A sorting domain-containing protein [Chitinophagales bacterium]
MFWSVLPFLLENTPKKVKLFFKCLLICFCSVGLSYALKAQCPLLTVDIGSTSLQICSENQYFVHYCNEGDVLVENVQIGVTFPSTITFKDSELPAERIDDIYFFEVGTMEAGQCGDFSITVAVVCDVLIGKTACVVAHISPNDACEPPSDLWDKANIEVTGQCLDGKVIFTISNTGEGDMAEPSQYRIYEDDIFVSSGTKFQMLSGESITVSRTPNGRTISLAADQSLFHPQRDTPKASVEACGNPPYSLGIVNKFPQNDQLPFTDYDCQQIEGVSKGTEKLLSPSGAGADRIVSGKAQLTYKIRFQNDEGMPIERLVIRDVLSPYLDISRLELGASSHPYTFQINAANVLVWTFENINLPSSETDLEGSQGFVQFKIHVIDEELLNIQIDNQASMRFGNNSPVFTNPVHHFTGDLTLDLDRTIVTVGEAVEVYPIPARDYLHFVLVSQQQFMNSKSLKIELYNLMGEKIKSVLFEERHTLVDINDLMEGMYMYRIQNERGVLIQSGKIYVY